LRQTDNHEKSIKDVLLDPDGPELGDDFLALCGERNRRLVERLRTEKGDTKRLEQSVHPRIGVLALQGDYAAHAAALRESGATPSLVKSPDDLRLDDLDGESLDGIVLPGGESTTMLKFLERHGLFEALKDFCAARPTFGTCAGAILLARQVLNPPQRSLGLLDAIVERNAYGRQIDSAILHAETALAGGPLEMVFIRAPRIVAVGGGVETLALREGAPVLVRQGALLAATFHPELSSDRRVHRLFVDSVRAADS
jgi:pyridoxal 5'-phosphate synthase pdxT subunit